ncbi:MAG: hypothetical protein ABFD02_05000 [Bacteroidales bacterium]
MKQKLVIFLLTIFEFSIFCQENPNWKNGESFNSVFQKLDTGCFKGSASGVLFIKNNGGVESILDFQGSYAQLRIIKDDDEVYDNSTKEYIGKTTSGLTEIKYQTYALANSLGIKFGEQWYELSFIDGACDIVINGLNYYYKAENTTEYLVIIIDRELVLDNWQCIIRTEHTMEPDNIKELESKRKEIKILPNSTIVFAINRK